MPGILVFTSLAEAHRAGFEICGRFERGYYVRCRMQDRWTTAVVELVTRARA